MTLAVSEISSAAGFAAVEREWGELVDTSAAGSFFETPEWLTSWVEAFWAPRPTAFLFVRDAGRLVGFAPLLADTPGDAWCPKTLTLPYHSHVARTNVVAEAGRADDVLDAMLAHVVSTRRSPRVVLARLSDGSNESPNIGRVLRRQRLASLEWPDARVPWIRIAGDWDTYLATRSSHVRTEMRRKRRRIERAGRLKVRVFSEPGSHRDALRDVMEVERGSWKHEQGTSLDTESGAAAFYDTLAERAGARGWLRVYVLYVDGSPLAHLYGVVHKNQYLALKTSYVHAHGELSPGAVLFEHALRDAFERGYTSFDMLGVESRWKNELATDVREPSTTCIFSPWSLRCRTCRSVECTVKPFVRQHAAWALEWRRRLRDHV